MNGSKIPLLTENNTNSVRSYYDDGKSTQYIVLTRSTGVFKPSIYANRTYLLVPTGFDIAKLIVPGTPSLQDQEALDGLTAFLPMTNP